MHRGPICFNTYFTSEYEQFLFLLFFILSSPLYPLVIAVYFILKQVLFPLTEFVSTLPYINSPVSGTFLSCSFILWIIPCISRCKKYYLDFTSSITFTKIKSWWRECGEVDPLLKKILFFFYSYFFFWSFYLEIFIFILASSIFILTLMSLIHFISPIIFPFFAQFFFTYPT